VCVEVEVRCAMGPLADPPPPPPLQIMNIARSIEELAQIFKELAVLVIDQGTILDRIDYNMEAAVDHAKEGVQELVKAEEHQKSATPIKCIAFLVLGIIILLAILIHRWSK